uniref:Uncharacterized protein n=1 Tax=Marseillevirus LCMAC103 TaxID=2506604 RepID=A0A481YVG5_9VIRU|nr:MAG: hypothetical protein LCMAC103_04330 [Marseillevirus LCMAC103]
MHIDHRTDLPAAFTGTVILAATSVSSLVGFALYRPEAGCVGSPPPDVWMIVYASIVAGLCVDIGLRWWAVLSSPPLCVSALFVSTYFVWGIIGAFLYATGLAGCTGATTTIVLFDVATWAVLSVAGCATVAAKAVAGRNDGA